MVEACGNANITKVANKVRSPMGHEVGLQASAGRGFSPPTCIVLYCIALVGFLALHACIGSVRFPAKVLERWCIPDDLPWQDFFDFDGLLLTGSTGQHMASRNGLA